MWVTAYLILFLQEKRSRTFAADLRNRPDENCRRAPLKRENDGSIRLDTIPKFIMWLQWSFAIFDIFKHRTCMAMTFRDEPRGPLPQSSEKPRAEISKRSDPGQRSPTDLLCTNLRADANKLWKTSRRAGQRRNIRSHTTTSDTTSRQPTNRSVKKSAKQADWLMSPHHRSRG